MKTFKRKIENFTCEYCGEKVKGNGYTNHCPKCLYSKHVDIYPGDRRETCGGLMPPVNFELVKGEYVLVYKCMKCGAKRRNHMTEGDSMAALEKLSETIAKKLFF